MVANGFTGFGFSLISAMGRSLTSAPNINLKPTGLECMIRVPLETIASNAPSVESQDPPPALRSRETLD